MRQTLTADDWKATLESADQGLLGMSGQGSFDQFPKETRPTDDGMLS